MHRFLVAISLSVLIASPAAAFSGGCRVAAKALPTDERAASAGVVLDATGSVASTNKVRVGRAVEASTAAPPLPRRPDHCGETPRN